MKRKFWKFFFFLMVALTISGLVLPFAEPLGYRGSITSELFLLPLYVTQLVALFGLAYSRPFGSRRIWQVVFGVTLLNELWGLYGILKVPTTQWELSFIFTVVLLIVLLLIPLCIGLYSYAFNENDLWANAT